MNSTLTIPKKTKYNRLLGQLDGLHDGICYVLIGGVHGNEPSGVQAIKTFFSQVKAQNLAHNFHGNIYGIAGNISALRNHLRYNERDLNRIWTSEQLSRISKEPTKHHFEDELEQKEIFGWIRDIIQHHKGEICFIDLHTTSSKTMPFITINDTIANRKLASSLPIPMVIGIEEFLSGTIMDFINELGYPAVGIESGQHDDPTSVKLHLASIWKIMVETGALKASQVDNYLGYHDLLERAASNKKDRIYEVIYRHEITPLDKFQMDLGYQNFQAITMNQPIAIQNNKSVVFPLQGSIFMPLYQNQGAEGFFVIREVKAYWLNLSTYFRNLKLDYLLTFLPGIQRDKKRNNVLQVNPKIARFLSRELMHLLGYRRMVENKHEVRYTKREVKPGTWPKYLTPASTSVGL